MPGRFPRLCRINHNTKTPENEYHYGRSYLQRDNAIALYDTELPLRPGLLPLLPGLAIPGSLRDAAPDAWGRRVILNRRFGAKAPGIDPAVLDELSYLIESGSDRIGALDFQRSPTQYAPFTAFATFSSIPGNRFSIG